MPRPKSRACSLTPCRITDGEVRQHTNLFDLDDAKAALGIEPEETFRDADLLICIPHAQAYIEKLTALHLAPVQVKAQYENWGRTKVSSLMVPLSDVIRNDANNPIVVTEYPDEDSDGVALSAVDVDASMGRTYITRTDGDYFPNGYDIVVEVVFYRGVQKGAQIAELVKMLFREVIIEMNKINGITAAVPPQLTATFVRNPQFMDNVKMCQNAMIMSRRIT